MEPVALHTERLTLSIPTVADVDDIFEACQDPGIQRYTTVPSPYERHHAEEFITKVAQEWAVDQHVTWAIREGDRLVGMIGLYRLDGRGGGEIGYWMAPWGRGGGRLVEAANAVIDWGYDPGGAKLARIEWRAVAGNIGSARVARTLGFRYEGLLRLGLSGGEGRDDGWVAGLLVTDERTPQPWALLGD